MYKLGIDVGGTNTDAVIIDDSLRVIAEMKRPTSSDIYSGIVDAIRSVLQISGVEPKKIRQAMLGTTQCTNAIVERKRLAPVALIRIGAPATQGLPPMVDWDEDIRSAVAADIIVGGGYEYDGSLLAELDEEGIRTFLQSVKGKVASVAVSCVFSGVRAEQEKRAAEICREVLGEQTPVSISSEIGSMGLIERENATILNAALVYVAQNFTEGFARSLSDMGITEAEIYLSQNDGTLMTMEHARKYPVLTIACGPTNSIRGASYLSGKKNALVIDVGGTTTDLGMIQNGFPRESSIAATIGGVRTNFRMPDVVTIGLGGGSIVRQREDGSVKVGPDSVGYELTSKALVFGGDTLTATDIAVRLGMVLLGDPEKVQYIDNELAEKAMTRIREMTEDAIDAMKVSSADVDVILVGGGSIILPEDLKGAASVVKPDFFRTANAIGSAISKVSGVVEKLIDYDRYPREQALEEVKREAARAAEQAGAIPETIEVIEVEDVPLQYYPGNTCRVKVKAAGELR